jgi:type II secretory pathway pseudopilin PulG
MPHVRRITSGFTLIETVIATGVLLIYFAAITMIVQQILQDIGQARVRTTGLMVAESQMETIRNLPYTSIGTQGGIPQGSLAPSTIITINSMPFTLTTSVIYVDDPYDGVAPTDIINTDYKRVRVEVTWGGAFPSRQPVSLVTNIVPKGIETVVGGGTIMLQAIDNQGLPVQSANVTIDNTIISPAIHMTTVSNINGIVVLPGAPACNSCYKITVTKSGYSTDQTYSTSDVANPSQPYATVIEGAVTQRSFSIDPLATLWVYSTGPASTGYAPVSNVMFRLKGSKIIGYTTTDDPVYKYDRSMNTGGGSIQIPALESDIYTIDMNASLHMLGGINPSLPITLLPGASVNASMVALPKTNVSYLVTVKNTTGTLQASASALLTNIATSSTMSAITAATGSADYGQAFFSGLSIGSYLLTVNLPGYQEATNSVSLSTNQSDVVTLNPVP